MLAYSPWDFRCCQHNVSHGWPYFAEELWHATADRGLCATMYAACDVTAKVGPGDGTAVEFAATTDYPFSDTDRLEADDAQGGAVPALPPHSPVVPQVRRDQRQPRRPALINQRRRPARRSSVDDGREPIVFNPLSFLRIERDWQSGDTVEVRFPMAIRVRTWAKNKNSVSVDYGPLTFSLKIGEKWSRVRPRRRPKWPEFELSSHDAVELRPGAGREEPGRLVRVGPQLGAAGPAAVHAGDRSPCDQGEGPEDPRLDAGQQRPVERLAAEPGAVDRAAGDGDADSDGGRAAADFVLPDDRRRAGRPRLAAAEIR